MKPILVFILSILAFHTAHAQLEKVNELHLSKITAATVDRLGNFYFVLASGKIQKYDPDGKLLDESEVSALPLTLLEPWNPLKIFSYSKQDRHIRFWDHHLNIMTDTILEPSLSINPQLVCPANENNKAWIIDLADYSLKRVDLITNEIEMDTTLPPDWVDEKTDFIFMREYQNRVFILDRNNGILMLNNLGIPITRIKIKGLTFFNFLGEELCYRKDHDILLLDLFTGDTRVITRLLDSSNLIETILTDERLVVVTIDKIDIFKYN